MFLPNSNPTSATIDSTSVLVHNRHRQNLTYHIIYGKSITFQMVWMGNARVYGQFYVLFSTVASGIQSVIVKTSDDIDPFLMASFRSFMVFLVAFSIVSWRSDVLYFPPGKILLMSVRSTCSSIAIILNYYSFRHLPLCNDSKKVPRSSF